MKRVIAMLFVCGLSCLAVATATGILKSMNSAEFPDPVATMLNPEANDIYARAYHNLSFSPDGKLLAIGQGTGNVLLLDAEQWTHRKTFRAHDNWAFSVIFSSDSQQLITAGGDELIKVWDLDSTNSPTTTLSEHEMDVHALILVPGESKMVSAGDDKTPIIWDMSTNSSILKLPEHPKQITSLAINGDGNTVATGSRDSKVRLYDLDTGELQYELAGHEKDVMSVRFSPDGEYVASASYDGCVCVWDADMGYLVEKRSNHQGAAVCVDFSPDGKEIVSVDHQTLTFLQTDNLKARAREIKPELKDSEQMSFVRYSPDGKRLAVSTTFARVLVVDIESRQVVLAVEQESNEVKQKLLPAHPRIETKDKTEM